MISYILCDENAVYYECGFSCDNVLFLRVDNNKAFFITDSRYTTEASEIIKNAKVIEGGRDLVARLREILQSLDIKKLAFNPREWSVDLFERISENLSIEFIKTDELSRNLRILKTDDEINIIKKAVRLGEEVFDEFCEFIKSRGIGLSEKELHFECENIFKKKGDLGLSFSPIVAINENAAKPHALPSEKILKNGDLLLLDGGIKYKRYCSDRTRCVEISQDMNFGKKQSFTNKEIQKVYDLVLKAQESAIKQAKAGMKASEVDKICRDVITNGGYGEFFIHSTGHGVGLDIHELPFISTSSNIVLEENMIFTIEPGVYLPNNFGIRIEDMVLVTKNGVEVL